MSRLIPIARILFPFCLWFLSTSASANCAQALVDYAYAESGERTPNLARYWRAQKSSDGTRALVDLSDFGPEIAGAKVRHPTHGTEFTLHRYEADLLNLRTNHTIRFDETEFTLGAFLGAGDSDHIWELKPSFQGGRAAIRLPSPSRISPFDEGLVKNGLRAYQESLVSIQELVEGESQIKIRHVRILSHDARFRYAVVTRVYGNKNALDLFVDWLGSYLIVPDGPCRWFQFPQEDPAAIAVVSGLERQYGPHLAKVNRLELMKTATDIFYESSLNRFGRNDRPKLRALLDLNRKFRMLPFLVPVIGKSGQVEKLFLIPGDMPTFFITPVYDMLREIVWDEVGHRWIMVDWGAVETEIFRDNTVEDWMHHTSENMEEVLSLRNSGHH